MANDSIAQTRLREDPAIEALKLDLLDQARGLAFNQVPQRDAQGNVVRDTQGRIQYTAAPKTLAQQLPNYQVAGFSPAQQAAITAATLQGIGAFNPYMTNANTALSGAYATTGEAADVLRGADTRKQFTDAQSALTQAGGATADITSGLGQLSAATGYTDPKTGTYVPGYLDIAGQRALASDTTGRFTPAFQDINTGIGSLATAQNMAAQSSQANLAPSTAAIGQGLTGLTEAQRMAALSAGADFAGSQALLGSSLGGFDPSTTKSFTDPFREQVIDKALEELDRQEEIAQQGLSAQAVRSGAFGGEREGVQRAELKRNILQQKANTLANLLSQGYTQAQANALMAFEQEQQRGMQAGQVVGQQAAQQTQLGQAASGLYGNLASQQVAAGQGLGALGVQQAQLGQGAANIYQQAAQQYGNLASQQGALAGQEAAINQNISNLMLQQAQARQQAAQGIAGIYGQQAGQFQNLGQGIGQLATQQFGIGQSTAGGLGQLAGQLGQLGVQQGALGQTAQALQQGDINFLYNVGQSEQALNQQTLDATRANTMQTLYSPYQQAAFLSDIYRGAPSTQMSTQVASQPTASPFQQAVGIGLGTAATAVGLKKAGLFGP